MTDTAAPTSVAALPGYDPSGLMSQIRGGVVATGEHPCDLVLGWLMSLPLGIDPAYAARALLRGWPRQVAPEVHTLLEEISRYPRDRLEGLLAYRRLARNGGSANDNGEKATPIRGRPIRDGRDRRRGRWVRLGDSVRWRSGRSAG